jgi:hypothetical protein
MITFVAVHRSYFLLLNVVQCQEGIHFSFQFEDTQLVL